MSPAQIHEYVERCRKDQMLPENSGLNKTCIALFGLDLADMFGFYLSNGEEAMQGFLRQRLLLTRAQQEEKDKAAGIEQMTLELLSSFGLKENILLHRALAHTISIQLESRGNLAR